MPVRIRAPLYNGVQLHTGGRRTSRFEQFDDGVCKSGGTSVSMPRLLDYQFYHAFAHDDIALRDTKPLTRTLISSAHHVEFAGAAVGRMGNGHAALQWLVQAGARTCLSATSACGRFAGDIQIVSAIRWPNQLYSDTPAQGLAGSPGAFADRVRSASE